MAERAPYAPLGWVDNVTPDDAARRNSLEAAVALAPQSPVGLAAGEVPVWTGTGWERSSVQKIQKASLGALGIVNADVDPAAGIAKSKLAALAIVNADVAAGAAIDIAKLNIPADATKFARGDGTWAVPAAGGSPTFCQVYRTADLTGIATTTWTAVTWTAELADAANLHDLVTNPTRIILNATGKWLINAYSMWIASDIGAYRREHRVWVNNTNAYMYASRTEADNADSKHLTSSDVLQLSSGDYVELQVYHNKGSNATVEGGNVGSTHLTVTYLGA